MPATPTPPAVTRRRAPGMSPDKRREMIVHTALPLVAEFGAAVTTSQIARAAGIGEATIFRVFADKDELLNACLAEVLHADHVLDALAEIPLDQPLAARLTEAAEVMRAHLDRLGAVISALHASGHWRAGHGGGHPTAREAGPGQARQEAMRATIDALTRLFAPDQDTLRLPAGRLASAFGGMVFTYARTAPLAAFSADRDGGRLDMAELVDLFLHGAVTVPDGAVSVPDGAVTVPEGHS